MISENAVMRGSYDDLQVGLSVLIASSASYAALELAVVSLLAKVRPETKLLGISTSPHVRPQCERTTGKLIRQQSPPYEQALVSRRR